MKNIFILLVLALLLTSCSTRITVASTTNGRVVRINEPHSITSVGDTIIVASTLSGGYSYYGKYIGIIPKDIMRGKLSLKYSTFTRIK